MTRYVMASMAMVFFVPILRAEDATFTEGNWRLSQHGSPASDLRQCVLKIEKKAGKYTASVVDTRQVPVPKGKDPQKLQVKVGDLMVDGGKVRAEIQIGTLKWTFEGTVDPKNSKLVRGSLQGDRNVVPASLNQQEGEKIVVSTAAERPKMPEPYSEAIKLQNAPFLLQNKAQQSKDVNEKADLLEQAKAARKAATEKTPDLFRQTAEKHADSPFAAEAALRLIPIAAKIKATTSEVASWVKLIEADAVKYGPRYVREAALNIAEDLVVQKGYEPAALTAATKSAEGMMDKEPLAVQSRTLKALVGALTVSGKVQDAKVPSDRLAKVDGMLDDEYLRTVPPFKPETFAGRKDKEANRVAVFELFTGAQCPPCVAADVAFDGLNKAYTSKDVVLIQYHMHIPGPDPMTNPATMARWDYYREKYPMEVRGTPTSLFNGKPGGGTGGFMPDAERKFQTYKKLVDELLEQKTTIKIDGSAKLAGDKISVNLSVDGIKEPGKNVKLRVLLVEETIKYAGSNNLRFHHQVVRAIPDVKDGTSITEKSLKKSLTIDLPEVKSGLKKYLDDFAIETPFPNLDRPLDLKNLKVIALVQDDESLEILNAMQFDVK